MRADMYEKDGQKRTMNKVMIFGFDLLSTKASRQADREEKAAAPAAPLGPPETKEPSVAEPPVEAPSEDKADYPDEIPFYFHYLLQSILEQKTPRNNKTHNTM